MLNPSSLAELGEKFHPHHVPALHGYLACKPQGDLLGRGQRLLSSVHARVPGPGSGVGGIGFQASVLASGGVLSCSALCLVSR